MSETKSSSILPWSFISDKVVYKTPVLDVLERRVLSPKDGLEKCFTVFKAPSWVNVLALTEDNLIVMVNQYRHGSRAFSLELPGGVVEPKDSLETAARRELLEETGYSAENFELFLTLNPNPAIFGNGISTFLAKGAKKTGQTHFDPNEETELVLVSLADLEKKIVTGEINHALMLSPLSLFLLKTKSCQK
ncbi:MAG: NUDIX hydrolase [Deltaproteobacteria bacterium]|nr:NUDIX hydrolase [Deltaproteobacteria bacterium]